MPAANQRNSLGSPKTIGLIALGLLLTLIFMVLRFPYDRLAVIIEARVEHATGIRVHLNDLGPHLQLLGPGLSASDVQLTLPNGTALTLERVELRPAWALSWFVGNPAFSTKLVAEAGEADGTLTLSDTPSFAGTLVDLDLSLLPASALASGMAITGRADTTVEFTASETGPEGILRVAAWDGSLEHPALPMVIPFTSLMGELRLGGEHRAEILSLDLESPLVTGTLSGTMGHSPTPESAPLHFEGSFTVSGGIRGALNAQGMEIGNSGIIDFVVTGTPAQPILR